MGVMYEKQMLYSSKDAKNWQPVEKDIFTEQSRASGKPDNIIEKMNNRKKIENNIKEARISTLQKIVELGFGGRLEVSVIL